jgi:hypothetical protein
MQVCVSAAPDRSVDLFACRASAVEGRYFFRPARPGLQSWFADVSCRRGHAGACKWIMFCLAACERVAVEMTKFDMR